MAKGVGVSLRIWNWINKIPIKYFPADWKKHGINAGFIRNALMCDYVGPNGGLIALWDGKSKGTKKIIDLAKGKGLAVSVYMV